MCAIVDHRNRQSHPQDVYGAGRASNPATGQPEQIEATGRSTRIWQQDKERPLWKIHQDSGVFQMWLVCRSYDS